MKATINKNVVYIVGKLSEEHKITNIYKKMMSEFESMCLIESFGVDNDAEMVEVTLSYSSDETTVNTVKESYSEAKNANRS